MGTINSKRKGKVAELNIAHILQDHGYDARRTAQYCGNTGDASDVVGLDGFHIEVKHQERIEIDKWWKQTTHDAKESGTIPLLVFRKNRQNWRVCLDFETFLDILKSRE